MKLEKAIEVNKSLLDGTYDHRTEEMEDALKLLIEAGKRIVSNRLRQEVSVKLPGETKD